MPEGARLGIALHNYGALVAPTAAIINGFIAVLVAQFFKDHPIAKVVLVVSAAVLGAAAIGATFYSQHEIAAAKATLDAKRTRVREGLGLFIAQGNGLMQEISANPSHPVPLNEANDWDRRAENFLNSELGNSFVVRFGDATGAPPVSLTGADPAHQNLWYGIYTRVLRLEQFSEEVK